MYMRNKDTKKPQPVSESYHQPPTHTPAHLTYQTGQKSENDAGSQSGHDPWESLAKTTADVARQKEMELQSQIPFWKIH